MAEATLSMAGFERQFHEHAEIAAQYRVNHRLPVAVNRLMSRSIVGVYRLLRLRRGFG